MSLKLLLDFLNTMKLKDGFNDTFISKLKIYQSNEPGIDLPKMD